MNQTETSTPDPARRAPATTEASDAARVYLEALASLGATQRTELAAITQALHHLLAGGRVTVVVDQPGLPEVVGDLDAARQRALRDVKREPVIVAA